MFNSLLAILIGVVLAGTSSLSRYRVFDYVMLLLSGGLF